MGVPTLRLRADYLAIVTIAAAEIFRHRRPFAAGSTSWTGSSDGLTGFTEHLLRPQPVRPRAAATSSTCSPATRCSSCWSAGSCWRSPSLIVLAADPQPVGPCAQGDPRGRGRRPQPRQERLLVQDAGADPRRHVRRARRHAPRDRLLGRPARQLHHRRDVLRLGGADPRRRRQGARPDGRCGAAVRRARASPTSLLRQLVENDYIPTRS